VIRVDDLEVEVTVRRVARMNVRVHPPDGAIRASVPPHTSMRSVARFVRSSRDWIDHHRARIREETRVEAARPRAPRREGVAGELWWWFGRPLRLEVVATSGRARVLLRPQHRLLVQVADPGDRAAVRAALDRWQRRTLRRAASPLLDTWAERMGVRHSFLGLRRMTTRWGSCVPANGRIWLNVELVMRRPALLEYVVVHELAHLVEASHGPAFQRLMDLHLPDWRARREELDRSSS
jgi:predicted metal-dependent hydrolase